MKIEAIPLTTWYICQMIQGAVDKRIAEAKSCERHCGKICGTTYHVEKPSVGSRQTTQPPQVDQ